MAKLNRFSTHCNCRTASMTRSCAISRLVTLIVCLGTGLLACGCSRAVIAEPSCRYEASVTLDWPKELANVVVDVAYRNNGRSSFNELVVRFNPLSEKQMFQVCHVNAGQAAPNPLLIEPWTRNGQVVGNHYVVRLTEPLKPGGVIRLQTVSRTAIKDRYGIKHLDEAWHPKIVHRSGQHWQVGVDEFASYRLVVGPLDRPVIPISGVIGDRLKLSGDRFQLIAEAENVPEFGMVFSHADHYVAATQDGVTVRCFYLKDRGQAERMLQVAQDVIAFYRQLYGFYPDRKLDLIAFDGRGFGGGPIGSNVVHVNKTFEQSEEDTCWAVAHEIGHQYWGWGQVADAHPELEWVCLGMGLWTDKQYMDARGMRGQDWTILDGYISAVAAGEDTSLGGSKGPGRRMNSNDLAHSKGYAVALMLEYVLGREALVQVARELLQRYAHKPVGQEQLRQVSEEVTGQDLQWFFRQWGHSNVWADFAIDDVRTQTRQGQQELIVSTISKGGAKMPLEVQAEYQDGSLVTYRAAWDQTQIVIPSDKPWRNIVIDPDCRLPDPDRNNNRMLNPTAPPAFTTLKIDPGDLNWGINFLKVHVRNNTLRKRELFVHVGGRQPEGIGFGMGRDHIVKAKREETLLHWYWIPPGHGTFDLQVKLRAPIDKSRPQDYPGFLKQFFPVSFAAPYRKCGDLNIVDWSAFNRKVYKGIGKVEPLECFGTAPVYVYCSPGTPAHADVKKILAQRHDALDRLQSFTGLKVTEPITIFFYPDAVTKRMFTLHEGNGLARGRSIHEIYNQTIRVSPSHELTHIIMSQLGDPPAMFNEGFAVYMQEDHPWRGRDVDVIAAKLAREGRLTDLKKLLAREEIGSQNDDGQVAYPQSGSFVGFLLGSFGKDKFLEAYARLQNGGSEQQQHNLAVIEEVFGQQLEQLQQRWRGSLMIGKTAPPKGREKQTR